MTNQELIAKFDPANAVNLEEADLEIMRKLTDDQISVLAKAYPNTPQRNPYLLLWDTKVTDPKKQLYAPSTWQNLNNVRKFSGLKNLVPYTFRALHVPARKAGQAPTLKAGGSRPKVQVDLSAAEAADELKKAIQTKTITPGKESEKKQQTTGTRPATGKGQTRTGGGKGALKSVPATQEEHINESPADESQEFSDGTGD